MVTPRYPDSLSLKTKIMDDLERVIFNELEKNTDNVAETETAFFVQ